MKPTMKICACCGGETIGIQWFNQDKGYGLCLKCYEWIKERTYTDMERTYGKKGIHCAIE
jgi:hypothetical protein